MTRDENLTPADQRQEAQGTWIALSFLSLAAGLFFLLASTHSLYRYREVVSSYEAKEAQITESRVFYDKSFAPATWRLVVAGHLLEDGTSFSTSVVSVATVHVSSRDHYQEYADRFPVGSVRTVFVAPEDLSEVILLRKDGQFAVFLMPALGLVLLAVGAHFVRKVRG